MAKFIDKTKAGTVEKVNNMLFIYSMAGARASINIGTGEVIRFSGEAGTCTPTMKEIFYSYAENLRDNGEGNLFNDEVEDEMNDGVFSHERLTLADSVDIAYSANYDYAERMVILDYIRNYIPEKRITKEVTRTLRACKAENGELLSAYSINQYKEDRDYLARYKNLDKDAIMFIRNLRDYGYRDNENDGISLLDSYKFAKMLDKEDILYSYDMYFRHMYNNNGNIRYTGHGYGADSFDENDLQSMVSVLSATDVPIARTFENFYSKINVVIGLANFWDKYQTYVTSFTRIGRAVEFRNYTNNLANNRKSWLMQAEAKEMGVDAVNAKLATIMNEKDLHFEDDDFIIVVPQTLEEIMREGEAQHNCVFVMHSKSIFRKDEKIVFMRRKSNPDKSYITVTAFTRSWGYGTSEPLKTYNQGLYDSDAEDAKALAFLNKYNEYLHTLGR